MGLTRAFKRAVDASAPDSQRSRDVSDLFALLKEAYRILCLRPRSRLPTLVLPLRLCFGAHQLIELLREVAESMQF